MKVSDVTNIDLAKYVRLDDASDLELNELERMRSGAVAFIKSYTGLTDEEVDEHEDITQVLFILVADMFDNRNYQMDSKSVVNPAVKSILNLHSVNLL
jgi:hypothetical protein|nr:MAG TPA: hypothetical protein [Caudoviricetes sp.]